MTLGMLQKPEIRVFSRQSGGKLRANILYYSDDSIHTIEKSALEELME